MSDVLKQLADFLANQWPVLLLLIYQYMKAQAAISQVDAKTKDLDEKIKAAHDKIDAIYSTKSDAAIVVDAANSGSNPKP